MWCNKLRQSFFHLLDFSKQSFLHHGFDNELNAEHPYPVYANDYESAGLQGDSKSCRVTRDAVTVSARGTIGRCFIRKGNFTPIVKLITMMPNRDIIVEYFKEAIELMEIKSSGTS